jgi:hypothetical protein
MPTKNAAKQNPPKPSISVTKFEASEVMATVHCDTGD